MALFFMGLHAYPLEEAEILEDLQSALGYREIAGAIQLRWPMMFFEICKAIK